MTGAQIIACYEELLAIMRHMHEAAKEAQWDRLVALEHDCKSVVLRLAADPGPEPLDRATQQRKAGIIRQVLEVDAAIRSRTEPWLAHLQGFLGTRQRERNLRHAYGAPDGA